MAKLDQKLARGIARRATRAWEATGPAARSGAYVIGDRLMDARRGGPRPSTADFNVPLAAHLRSLSGAPGLLHLSASRAGPTATGRLDSRSLAKTEVLHIRGEDRDFVTQDWCVHADEVAFHRGATAMRLWTPPVLVDQHLVERWVERSGHGGVAGLTEALEGALPLAILHAASARSQRMGTSADVAVPAPGGAFLGGTELVVAGGLDDALEATPTPERRRGLSLRFRELPSRLIRVVSLRTFLDDALLSTAQLRHVADLAVAGRALRDELAASPGLIFEWDEPDDAVMSAVAALMSRTQGLFDHWRRRLDTQGLWANDFVALEEWAHRGDFRGATMEDAVLRIANIARVPEASVRLIRRGVSFDFVPEAGPSPAPC